MSTRPALSLRLGSLSMSPECISWTDRESMYFLPPIGVLILYLPIFLHLLYSLKSSFTHSSLHLQQKITLGLFTVMCGAIAQQFLEISRHACQGGKIGISQCLSRASLDINSDLAILSEFISVNFENTQDLFHLDIYLKAPSNFKNNS